MDIFSVSHNIIYFTNLLTKNMIFCNFSQLWSVKLYIIIRKIKLIYVYKKIQPETTEDLEQQNRNPKIRDYLF